MMKNFILFLIIFVLAVLLLMSVRSCSSERKEKEAAKETLNQALKNGPVAFLEPVIIYDTIFRTPINTYKPPIVGSDDNISVGVSPSYVDSISRALNVAEKNITDLTKANISLNAKLQMAFHEKDSVTGRLWASYQDNTFDIKYYPDSNTMEIKGDVGLNLVGTRSRSNVFKQWEYEASAWLTDDRFTINRFNQVRRELPKRSRWGVDAFIGPVYTPEGFKPVVIGIGVGYRIIEF